mmetsp:Transcript_18554/g.57019  ORF Transcript_18554/g.57019 Transcript_18554/m.57019 type:complete len:384 (+) Transcript_18554:85-1236(+)
MASEKKRKGKNLEELRSRMLTAETKKRPRCVFENEDEVPCRPREPRASPGLAGKLLARVAPPPSGGDYVRVVADVPEPSEMHGCSRFITSGPTHAKVEKQLRAELGIRVGERLDFRIVARESDDSRRQLERFLRYRDALPEKDRQAWCMWHGIRSGSARTNYDTDASRIDELDPSKVTPNAKRQPHHQNRLGDGLYFASHASYNVRGGFYEICRDSGAVKLLRCLVLPGNYHNLKFGSSPSLTEPPRGCDSRVAYAAPNSPVVIACLHRQDALFVELEVHIFGIHAPTSTSEDDVVFLGTAKSAPVAVQDSRPPLCRAVSLGPSPPLTAGLSTPVGVAAPVPTNYYCPLPLLPPGGHNNNGAHYAASPRPAAPPLRTVSLDSF